MGILLYKDRCGPGNCRGVVVEQAEARLSAELRTLYAAAGSPELADVVRWGAQRRPRVWFSVASLADWLRPQKVAVPSEEALLAFVEFLAVRAGRPVVRRWWAQLRRVAWIQTHPGVGPAVTDPLPA